MLGRLTGTEPAALEGLLEPIATYCQSQLLPPLAALVVNGTTGLPGNGTSSAGDVPRVQQLVFAFDWIAYGSPAVEQFVAAGPTSNGVGHSLPNGQVAPRHPELNGRERRGDIRRFFGAISVDNPRGLDNELIDADLAEEYGNTHENE